MKICIQSCVAILLLSFFLFGNATKTKAQDISIKNNLAYDATLTPNLGMEVKIDSLWSVGINAGIRIWPRTDMTTRKYRHLLVAPEVRRWFKTSGSGHFIGADILYTHYNIGGITLPFGLYPSVKDKRKQGDAVALGPFYGYTWNLARHWSIEAEGGINIGYAWSNVYKKGPYGAKTDFERNVFLMPKIGVNIVYTFRK